MPPKPPLELYLQRHADYQQFVAIVVLLGIALAWIVIKRGAGHGVRWRLPLWAIVGLGAALRLPLMTQDFWYDEAFTSVVTAGSWQQLWMVVLGDVHPPLYYAIVKVFTDVFGHNDIAMRLPALVSGLVLIVVMERVGRSHGIRHTTALVTAVWPAAIYYSAEARYPAFLALLLAVAYLGIRQRRYWLSSVMVSLAALTHVNAWFYVVLFAAVILFQSRRAWPALVPAAPILSWLPIAAQQAGDVADGFWLQQSTVIRYLVDMTITTRQPNAPLPLVIIVTAIGVSVLAVAVWRWRNRASWLWLTMFALPAVIQWCVGVVWNPIYLERTLLFSALLLTVPVAAWLERYARRLHVLASVGAVAVVCVGLWTTDRHPADSALALCANNPVVYAPTTDSAILAEHFTDALIISSPDGNNTNQSLPDDVRQTLWLLLPEPPPGSCVFAQVDSLTSQNQFLSLNANNADFVVQRQTKYAYFVVSVDGD